MHFTIFRQRPYRQYTLFGGIVHVGVAVIAASRYHKFAVFLHFTVHNYAPKHLRGPRVSFVPIGVRCHYVSFSVFNESGTSLSTARMLDDTQTECGQGFAVRHCLWNGRIAFIGRKIVILLLAYVQRESIRSSWTFIKIHKQVFPFHIDSSSLAS